MRIQSPIIIQTKRRRIRELQDRYNEAMRLYTIMSGREDSIRATALDYANTGKAQGIYQQLGERIRDAKREILPFRILRNR